MMSKIRFIFLCDARVYLARSAVNATMSAPRALTSDLTPYSFYVVLNIGTTMCSAALG